MQLFVKNGMTTKTYCMKGIKLEMLIKDFKYLLFEQIGIKPCDQRLLFTGKELQDDKPIEFYKIQKESTIFMVNRQKGG
jgi:hypothetical protein